MQLGTSVTLIIDLWDAPGATVSLRTWVDESGESIYPMTADDGPDGAVRYRAVLSPECAGIVWYHFIIVQADGHMVRYGACDGKTGGKGQLRDWEPPSFQLTVYDPQGCFPSRDEQDFRNSQSLMKPIAEFLLGQLSAPILAETIEALRENYSDDIFRNALAFLDGLSDEQLLVMLSGLSVDELTTDEDGKPILDGHHAGVAKGRLWCASLLQMLSPSNAKPAIVLADEPAHTDQDCENILCNAWDLRNSLSPCTDGSFTCFAANDDVLGLWRNGADGTCVCLLVNGSLRDAHDVFVPMCGEEVSDVVGGYSVPVRDADDVGEHTHNLPFARRYAQAHLYQIGSTVLYFHPKQQLQKPMEPGLGVLAHITSLPAPAGMPGTLGAPSRAFVDWLAQAGTRYWQVLPANPTDEFGSPYAGISAFAGNTLLMEGSSKQASEDCDTDDAADRDPIAYHTFCEREADWLEPYAAFMAIRQKLAPRPGSETSKNASENAAIPIAWQDWPKKYRRFNPAIIEKDPELRAYAERWRRAQFSFECQWKELRDYANERGVQIVGDMPIYVSADSADVWANPELFQLEPDGRPAMVAGCPPDAFAEEGQIWGNPIYDWSAARKDGYTWWLRRLQRAFELYDFVRLDHFIGFMRYFRIPQGEKATEGTYRPGPGIDLFRTAFDTFGPLPVIAEDLGSITPAVRALVAECGFPGMDIVQFVDGGDPLSGYRPRPEKIAYTGTHDNQTLVGYAQQRYPDLDAEEAAAKLMEEVATSSASVAILPLQDLMGLDDDARMNTPGTSKGNWTWQAEEDALQQALPTLRHLVELKSTPR